LPLALAIRTSSKSVVSVPRETEGKEKEKDEGSLSIPIIPIESREIRTAESRLVGKEDAGS